MIYELALVCKADCDEGTLSKITEIVKTAISNDKGETLVTDDWGTKTFAQPAAKGVKKGHYLYFIYKTDENTNTELDRLFKINENVIKSMIIKLGENEEQETIVKKYKTPFSKASKGSVTDDIEENSDFEKERKRFARRKSCWFTARNIKADWKDPATYSWLVNEFGKISPARVSGVSRKHQRFAEAAIKRARQIGVASYLTNHIAE